MRRRDGQETTQDRRRDERLPVHVLWVWVFPRESVFGPESIGKHITQLVTNWVFPRESVFGPESIRKHITQLVANWVFPRESVLGPESIGKHTTQLIANWVFQAKPNTLQAVCLGRVPTQEQQPQLSCKYMPQILEASPVTLMKLKDN